MNEEEIAQTEPYPPPASAYPYACKKCGTEFKKKQGLNMHMQRAHGNLQGNPQNLATASVKRRYTKRPLRPYMKRPYVRRTKPTPTPLPLNVNYWHFCPRCGFELRKEQS